jgi:gluconolactonase
MTWNFELLAGPYGGTSEGPVWNGEAILFSHIPTSRIMRYDPKTGQTTEYFAGTNQTNGLCFDAKGNLYGCQSGRRRIVRFETDRTTMTSLPHRLDGKHHNNPNDLAVDKKGRIWFTDPWSGRGAGEQELDHMSVLRLDPQADSSWTLQRMTYDLTRPNGILVSRDQKTLYVARSGYDQGPRELRAYPIDDDGALGNYTVLHTFGGDHRGPHRGVDGMTLDIEGNIVACAGHDTSGPGSIIYVFSPTGRVLETHLLGVDHPTNCCFGDPDMRTLYVTTGGGHLLRARTDRTGWIMWP